MRNKHLIALATKEIEAGRNSLSKLMNKQKMEDYLVVHYSERILNCPEIEKYHFVLNHCPISGEKHLYIDKCYNLECINEELHDEYLAKFVKDATTGKHSLLLNVMVGSGTDAAEREELFEKNAHEVVNAIVNSIGKILVKQGTVLSACAVEIAYCDEMKNENVKSLGTISEHLSF